MNEGACHTFNEMLPPMLYDYVAGIVIQAFSITYEDEFEIDRPFVYSIIKTLSNEETGVREVTPIFFGHIVDPIANIE